MQRAVIVLHEIKEVADHVRGVDPARYDVFHVPTWTALRAAVRQAAPTVLVVVDPYAETSGDAPSPALQSFLGDFPYIPVVAATRTRGRTRDVLTMARWGLPEVVSLDEPEYGEALRQRIPEMEGWTLRRALRRSLPRHLSGPAVTLLFTAAEVSTRGGSMETLSRVLGASRRSVSRYADRAALPPPRRLLAWMRLLLAAELLDDPGRKVYQVAHSVGYTSDTGLRTAFGIFLSQTPKQLRRRGAYATVSQAFWDEIRGIRASRGEAAGS